MVEQNAKLKADGRAPLDRLPKPCDYFDLIGGTSTGGCATSSLCSPIERLFLHSRIIALMLGRLRMDVDKVIECYNELSEKVFSDQKRWGDGKFKATKLEAVIKSAVNDATDGTETLLLEDDEPGVCRT